MQRATVDRTVFGLALVGILVVVHLSIMVDRGFDRGCFGFSEPTAVVECEAVIQSDAGTLFGVSNAVWGLIFYLAVVALSALIAFGKNRQATLRTLRRVLIFVGFAYSAWLIYVQATQIGAWCKLCVISASIVALLTALVTYDWLKNSNEPEPMQGKKLFAGLALATLVIALVDLTYFSRLAVAEPAPAAAVAESAPAATAAPVAGEADAPDVNVSNAGVCRYDPSIRPYEDYPNLVGFADPFQGTPQTGVQVLEFFDPNCPHCRTMHPIMKRVIETHGDQAQFFMIPFIVFRHSLTQIEALYVAAQDGKYYEMIDAQFEHQKAEGLSVTELAALAAEMDIDPEVFQRRVERGLNTELIAGRANQIRGLGVTGVPMVMINGRIVASESKTVACLQELIEGASS